MTNHALRFKALAVLLFLAQPAAAQVLNGESWVSNRGSDGNDCSLAHPCSTFQRAHDRTAPGGEIGVLTPGDYGPVLITKAVGITKIVRAHV